MTTTARRKGDPYILIEVLENTATTRVVGKVSRATWLRWFRLAKKHHSESDEIGGHVVERLAVREVEDFKKGLVPLELHVEVRPSA